jgi:DNA polymerase I-like protein with 3'-5' exonuclease and polymerase domains
MLAAIRNGEDLHRKTAALVLGKPESEVTKGDRQTAKALNFGLCYGQGVRGLVRQARMDYGVIMTEDEARNFRDRFFSVYAALDAWHKKARRQARATGAASVHEVRTLSGRRRLIPDGTNEWDRFTALVNTVVQGTAADGLKLAMIRIARELPAAARLTATIHDEVIVRAPLEIAEDVRRIVETSMREEMGRLFTNVPIEVESKICTNWGEK